MNPKLFRLTAGFLAGFVLLSVAPAFPDWLAGLTIPAEIAQADDELLAAAAVSALALLLLLLVARRRTSGVPAPEPARVTRASVESALRNELRRAVEQGERIPAIARRYHMAQDAVRIAVGRGPSSPAARAERVARARQRALPAPVPALPAVARMASRSSYHTVGYAQ